MNTKGVYMPEKKTLERALRDKKEGKSPSTQAGEFVREEMEHIRQGKHGARSTKQAIAIGLSKARRAGLDLPPPPEGKVPSKSRKSILSAYKKGHNGEPVSKKRSAARKKALKKEPYDVASPRAISKQTKTAGKKRSTSETSKAAKKAASTRRTAKKAR